MNISSHYHELIQLESEITSYLAAKNGEFASIKSEMKDHLVLASMENLGALQSDLNLLFSISNYYVNMENFLKKIQGIIAIYKNDPTEDNLIICASKFMKLKSTDEYNLFSEELESHKNKSRK